MPDTVRRVLIAAVSGLFVAGVAGLALQGSGIEGAAPTSPPATTASPKEFDSAVDDIRTVVPVLQRFVERERGLRFKKDVNVTLLDDASFRARLADDGDDDLEALDETARVLRALGLIDRDLDLEDARDDLLGQAVAGFYDPETEELVVRGARATALVRRVLVHELTHALQDQYFELHRPDLDERDDEASLAFAALVEGDASRVERAYNDELPADQREEADAEEERQVEGLADSDIPPVLFQFLGFPYFAGEPFVDAVVKAGGQERLDAAFSDPPTTSEQVLHPEVFLSGGGADVVDPPPAEGEVFDQGAIGEYGLYVILSAELPGDRAARAARGWDGDWYVAWDHGSDTCVRATVTMSRRDDRSELRDALESWADEHGDVEVETSGDLTTLTACG